MHQPGIKVDIPLKIDGFLMKKWPIWAIRSGNGREI
jgi:hypothetical protein